VGRFTKIRKTRANTDDCAFYYFPRRNVDSRYGTDREQARELAVSPKGSAQRTYRPNVLTVVRLERRRSDGNKTTFRARQCANDDSVPVELGAYVRARETIPLVAVAVTGELFRVVFRPSRSREARTNVPTNAFRDRTRIGVKRAREWCRSRVRRRKIDRRVSFSSPSTGVCLLQSSHPSVCVSL